MKKRLKQIMSLHRRLADCVERGERNVSLAQEIVKAEIDAFNEMYFCGNTIRLNMVAAIMEQYLETLKLQGVYKPDMVGSARALMASAFIPGGGGRVKGE